MRIYIANVYDDVSSVIRHYTVLKARFPANILVATDNQSRSRLHFLWLAFDFGFGVGFTGRLVALNCHIRLYSSSRGLRLLLFGHAGLVPTNVCIVLQNYVLQKPAVALESPARLSNLLARLAVYFTVIADAQLLFSFVCTPLIPSVQLSLEISDLEQTSILPNCWFA